MDIRPISPALGAEIHGVDLADDLGEDAFGAIRQALWDHGVIFFRDQALTPDQHLAFAQRWGEINVNRFFKPVEGYPMIAEVRKEPHQETNIGGNWHTDHSYDDIPAMGSVLYAREVPSVGGDTLFASMAKAYEALSDGMKATLAPLKAVHSSRHVFGAAGYKIDQDMEDRTGNQGLATQDAVHPIVLSHPETGRKGLYVNPVFTQGIEGWRDEESKPLLDYLYQHAARPEFVCRFQWRQGSLAVWDNRATWHYAANDYAGQRRLLHRITIEGVPLGCQG
ncbi:MAG: TauD/TfdA family dioxygenase [Pseudomonadota bacterium]